MDKFACVIFAIVIANFVFVDVRSKSLPSYISPYVCSRRDPNLKDCLLDLVERLRPMFANGMPEIKVPGLEPLRIPEITVSLDPKTVGLDSTTSVKAVARDVRCFGGSDFKINKLKLDLDHFTYIVGMEIPAVHCEADYNIDARILNIPIKGHGPISGNGTNIKATAIIKAKLVNKDDGNHLNIKHIDLSVDVEDASVKMGNNYQGDTLITEAFNTLVNANSKLFITAFTPIFEKTAANIALQFGNAITDTIVYDEFLTARK